jgi:hypothetical protein
MYLHLIQFSVTTKVIYLLAPEVVGPARNDPGAPYENRTRVSALRGQRPGPLDEGSLGVVSFTTGRTC